VHPTPHGYALGPADERLLRARPPAAALAWCARAVGPRAKVAAVRPLRGGTSSAVHAVDIRGTDIVRLVLRRFVRTDWLAREPDLAVREAAALELLRGTGVRAPRLVAVDPTGAEAGVPAVLMTRMAGWVTWAPGDLEPYLRALAEALPPVHAVPVPDASPLPAYEPYGLVLREPPRWSRRPDVWMRAFAVFGDPPPCPPGRRLIHRDYHPGNVLWAHGAVAGIVDWVNACTGPPDADAGHCRMNLARAFGLAAADRFLAHHARASGTDAYDPYWDVVAALGGFDEDDVARWTPREEDFLARAVAGP
jgi:aminoglycoside phosphotransferase (APT) family kinase protein